MFASFRDRVEMTGVTSCVFEPWTISGTAPPANNVKRWFYGTAQSDRGAIKSFLLDDDGCYCASALEAGGVMCGGSGWGQEASAASTAPGTDMLAPPGNCDYVQEFSGPMSMFFRPKSAVLPTCADAGTVSSCEAIKQSCPGLPSGIYSVVVDGTPTQVWCDMDTDGGGWMMFARVFEENDSAKYGFDTVDNGWAMGADTFISIEGVSFSEMIMVRRDTGDFYSVNIGQQVTWPRWGSAYTAGNGYTIAQNPDYAGKVIRAYDADAGKNFQLCFVDTHNDECGPDSAGDPNNYGDAGGNDDQNMLWAGAEVNAVGTGITWDFGIRP